MHYWYKNLGQARVIIIDYNYYKIIMIMMLMIIEVLTEIKHEHLFISASCQHFSFLIDVLKYQNIYFVL